MPQQVGPTVEMLLSLEADNLIGALILAVLIAAVTAGAYLWLSRGKSDVSALLVGSILIANLACMLVGAHFVQSRRSKVSADPRAVMEENLIVTTRGRFARPDYTRGREPAEGNSADKRLTSHVNRRVFRGEE